LFPYTTFEGIEFAVILIGVGEANIAKNTTPALFPPKSQFKMISQRKHQ
jgi:hypothetical protein